MAGYQYSHAYDKGGNFSHHESEMRTSLGSSWSPGFSQQGPTSFGTQDPLMESSRAPEAPYLQTRFSYLREPDRHSLQRSYSSKRQLLRHLRLVISRFLVTAASCGAIVYVFIMFEKKGVLNQNQKHLFNAIFLGLSLILSMNLIVSNSDRFPFLKCSFAPHIFSVILRGFDLTNFFRGNSLLSNLWPA